MKIQKFYEFIKENLGESPEEYISNALLKLQTKVKNMFGGEEDTEKVDSFAEREKSLKKKEGKMSLKDMGLTLATCEISKYSFTRDNLKIKYSDDKFIYDLALFFDLKDAINNNEEEDFDDTKIKKVYIKFKKYKNDDAVELIGEITKTIDVDKFDEDYLIKLTLDFDKEYGGEDGTENDEFAIQK